VRLASAIGEPAITEATREQGQVDEAGAMCLMVH
jgi:hypothetical protein